MRYQPKTIYQDSDLTKMPDSGPAYTIKIAETEEDLRAAQALRYEVFVKELGEQIPFYHERHIVKPGITGWAQLNFPYGASVDDARGADAGEADAIVARSRAKGGRRAASVSPRAGRPRAPPTAELTTTKRRACRGIGRISDSDLIRVGSGKINSSIDGYARTQRSALIGGEQIPCPV